MERKCPKKCDTDIAQTISDCSIKSNLHNCYYTDNKLFTPIKHIKYNGTKSSFEICLGNVSADPKLREFGLRYIVPFVLKNLPDLWLCEDLENVAEIIIIHENIVLLQVTNTKENLVKVLEIHVNLILKEMEISESKIDKNDSNTYYISEIHPLILSISDKANNLISSSIKAVKTPVVLAVFDSLLE